MPAPLIIDTFGDYYSHQPLEITNIIGPGMGEVEESVTKKFADGLAADSPITIFGDHGSVKDGRGGSHATHIYLGSDYFDTDYSIESAAITSGDPATIAWLGSETSSVLSGLYMLHLSICSHYSVTTNSPVHFIYANQESLR